MAHALLDDDHPIDFCANCRGMLLPRPTFATVTHKRRAWATTPPAEAVPLDRRELHRELRWPQVRRPLRDVPALWAGHGRHRQLRECDLIWLDFGEMRKIVDAPGHDRGSRHVPRADDQYVRQGPTRGDDDDEDDSTRRRRARDPLRFMIDVMFND